MNLENVNTNQIIEGEVHSMSGLKFFSRIEEDASSVSVSTIRYLRLFVIALAVVQLVIYVANVAICRYFKAVACPGSS